MRTLHEGPAAHGFALLAAWLLTIPVCGQEDTPCTRLFDSGVPSAQPLTGEAVSRRVGWALIPEDQVEHEFAGDAVLLNDRLAVVLTTQGRGAEVYSKTASGLKHRAGVGYTSAGSALTEAIGALKIVENSASAVMVQAMARDQASPALSLRLTTGEAILEIRSGDVAESVSLKSKTRYVVVPDYFGDDAVFRGGPSRGQFLPAENLCVHLLEGGEAIVMSVWQSSEQDAWLAAQGGQQDGLCSSRFRSLKGKSLWLAFLESPGLWHEGSLSAGDDWKPPFAAKWRCSLVHENGLADSWTTEQPDGTIPVRTADAGPLPAGAATVKQTEVTAPYTPLLVYPIDRSTATPLAITCPTDVMRNTLGVGPCQYILACEGLTAQGDPTPNAVRNWVEKQFEQKKARKAGDDIKERLQVMSDHVAQARARIQNYAAFAGQMRKLLANQPGAEPFHPIVEDLDRSVATGLLPTASAERARELAGEVTALVGQENALGACQRLGAQLRWLGAVQDRALAKSRMAVRRLRAQAETEVADHSPASDLAQAVQRRAEQRLQKK